MLLQLNVTPKREALADCEFGHAALSMFVQSIMCGIGHVPVHVPSPDGRPSHPHARSACVVDVACAGVKVTSMQQSWRLCRQWQQYQKCPTVVGKIAHFMFLSLG